MKVNNVYRERKLASICSLSQLCRRFLCRIFRVTYWCEVYNSCISKSICSWCMGPSSPGPENKHMETSRILLKPMHKLLSLSQILSFTKAPIFWSKVIFQAPFSKSCSERRVLFLAFAFPYIPKFWRNGNIPTFPSQHKVGGFIVVDDLTALNCRLTSFIP